MNILCDNLRRDNTLQFNKNKYLLDFYRDSVLNKTWNQNTHYPL